MNEKLKVSQFVTFNENRPSTGRPSFQAIASIGQITEFQFDGISRYFAPFFST